ncbi:hypothetical protein V7S79_04085 [Aquirufa sp. ROCK-SH2]
MQKLLFTIILLSLNITLNAQTGSIELSSGGFSFVPAFTSKEPNLIINASTNLDKKLTGHLMYTMRIKSMTPNTIALITRYKLLNKKFKASLGLHIPAMQVSEDYKVTSLFGQELNTSYPVSGKVTLGVFLLNGVARNSDFKALFSAFNVNYHKDKWNLLSQGYYLDNGNLTGVAESISYDIDKHFQAKAFANYTITDQFFIGTIGVNYRL